MSAVFLLLGMYASQSDPDCDAHPSVCCERDSLLNALHCQCHGRPLAPFGRLVSGSATGCPCTNSKVFPAYLTLFPRHSHALTSDSALLHPLSPTDTLTHSGSMKTHSPNSSYPLQILYLTSQKQETRSIQLSTYGGVVQHCYPGRVRQSPCSASKLSPSPAQAAVTRWAARQPSCAARHTLSDRVVDHASAPAQSARFRVVLLRASSSDPRI